MSSAQGKKQISNLIAAKFATTPLYKGLDTDFRKELDDRLVIVDISQRALEPNQVISKASFGKSYALFLETIQTFLNGARHFTSIFELEQALANKSYNINTRGVVLIEDPIKYLTILVAKDFDSIRRFITNQISSKLRKDTYFGTTYRKLHYSEIADDIASFNTSGFAAEHRAKYKLPENAIILNKMGELTDGVSKEAILTPRSNIDIGHIYDKNSTIHDTPLGSKLEAIANNSLFSSAAVSAANVALNQLHELHAELAYTYQNKGITSIGNIDSKATISLSLHHYKLNNLLAIKEAKIYREFLSNLAIATLGQEYINIHGSNTLLQDIGQSILGTLNGTSTKVAGHAPISGSLLFKLKNNRVSKVSKITPAKNPPPIRNLRGQFYSLTSLQTLLNTHLQDVVSANMGNEGYAGGQRRILNYRTGRFAESVKVERLSQSRAGAITAFYTYQKNPYEVFEPGHKMGTPLTRDPKLLIAKSIREIAATKVANTMRSVRV